MCNYRRCWKCPPPSWRQTFTLFAVPLATFQRVFWSLTLKVFSAMFKVIWATCIVAVDCFFEKFSQNEVRWCKVCGWWWPKGMTDNVITGEVLQVSCCGFCAMGDCHIMLKPAVLFVLFQESSWVKRFWKLFAVSLPCKKLGPQLDFRHCTANTNLWLVERISVPCFWVFGCPYCAVLIINISTQVEPCLVWTKYCLAHEPHLVKRTMLQLIELPHNW